MSNGTNFHNNLFHLQNRKFSNFQRSWRAESIERMDQICKWENEGRSFEISFDEIEWLHTSYIWPSYIRPPHDGFLWLHTVSHKTAHFFLMNKRTFSHFNEAYRHEHHSKKISKMPQNLITTDASWCEPQNLLSTLFFFSIFVWKLMHGCMCPNFNEFSWGEWIMLTRRQGLMFDVFFVISGNFRMQIETIKVTICVKQQIFQKRLFLGISSQLWAF